MFNGYQIEKFLRLSFILLTIGSCLLLILGFLFSAGMQNYVIDFSFIKYFFSTFTSLIILIIYSFSAYYGLKFRKNSGYIFGFSTILPLLTFFVYEIIRYFHIYIFTWNYTQNILQIIFILLLLIMLMSLIKKSNFKNYKLSDYIYTLILSSVFFAVLFFSPNF